MSSIREFIKRNASLILHIFVTLVICIFFNIFFANQSLYISDVKCENENDFRKYILNIFTDWKSSFVFDWSISPL